MLILRSYRLQSWVTIIPYALRAMVNTASFSQESATTSRHWRAASAYNSCPVNAAKSTPVSVSNIEDPESPQISSISDVKSMLNTPADTVAFAFSTPLELLRPDSKSLISASIWPAALVSFLIAFSPSVALYMALTSAADRPTAFKLLSWNWASNVKAWSMAFSVLRNSS